MRFLIKVVVSALVIAGVSELGKRSTALGSILGALPLSTLMAVIWLYRDTGDAEKVAALSQGIFWMILPSFVFMLGLPSLLRSGVRFAPSLALSLAAMFVAYAGYAWTLRRLGIWG